MHSVIFIYIYIYTLVANEELIIDEMQELAEGTTSFRGLEGIILGEEEDLILDSGFPD